MSSIEKRCHFVGCIFTSECEEVGYHVREYHSPHKIKYCFFCGFASKYFEEICTHQQTHQCPFDDELLEEMSRVMSLKNFKSESPDCFNADPREKLINSVGDTVINSPLTVNPQPERRHPPIPLNESSSQSANSQPASSKRTRKQKFELLDGTTKASSEEEVVDLLTDSQDSDFSFNSNRKSSKKTRRKTRSTKAKNSSKRQKRQSKLSITEQLRSEMYISDEEIDEVVPKKKPIERKSVSLSKKNNSSSSQIDQSKFSMDMSLRNWLYGTGDSLVDLNNNQQREDTEAADSIFALMEQQLHKAHSKG